jgi:hypothetical protein
MQNEVMYGDIDLDAAQALLGLGGGDAASSVWSSWYGLLGLERAAWWQVMGLVWCMALGASYAYVLASARRRGILKPQSSSFNQQSLAKAWVIPGVITWHWVPREFAFGFLLNGWVRVPWIIWERSPGAAERHVLLCPLVAPPKRRRQRRNSMANSQHSLGFAGQTDLTEMEGLDSAVPSVPSVPSSAARGVRWEEDTPVFS